MRPADARDEELARLRAARALCLYVLSFSAVAAATLAWVPAGAPPALALPAWAAVLGVALLAGEALTPAFGALEAARRLRMRLAAAAAYAGLVALALPLALAVRDLRLFRLEATLFVALQPAFLLLAGFGRGQLGVLENALVLAVLASLRGGGPAALAVLCYAPTLVFFLVLDHVARKLSAYPAARGPRFGIALRQAARIAAPALVALGVFLLAFPPAPTAGIAFETMDPRVREATTAAYRLLTLAALLGGAGVFLVGRILGFGRRRQPQTQERVEPFALGDEVLSEPARPRKPDYPGTRGRIVRAYVAFLAQAAALGLRRKPDRTPREFAAELRQPAEPLQALTELFMHARYGQLEPGDADVAAAERAAAETVAGMRHSRRGRVA